MIAPKAVSSVVLATAITTTLLLVTVTLATMIATSVVCRFIKGNWHYFATISVPGIANWFYTLLHYIDKNRRDISEHESVSTTQQVNNDIQMKHNEVYGVSTHSIVTTPNKVYGITTDPQKDHVYETIIIK